MWCGLCEMCAKTLTSFDLDVELIDNHSAEVLQFDVNYDITKSFYPLKFVQVKMI